MRDADELAWGGTAWCGGQTMVDLSIVIPCFNEEERLARTLKHVAYFAQSFHGTVEVLVVDDGSTDQTLDVAAAMWGVVPNLRIFAADRNRGKGGAVRDGMLAARGAAVLFMDADESTPVEEVVRLMPHLQDNDVVIGSRYLPASDVPVKQPWYRRVVSRLGNLLIRAVAVRGIHDTQCGFKLFRQDTAREVFRRQRTMRFGFDIEILHIAKHILGYRVKEVPVRWVNDARSHVKLFRDSWRTLRELVVLYFGEYETPQSDYSGGRHGYAFSSGNQGAAQRNAARRR